MTERPQLLGRVVETLGRDVVSWQRPECGLSAAERWVTQLADGSSVFVKAATDSETAGWLRNEHAALAAAGSRFGPSVIAWLDEQLPILITEDLSDAYWPAGTGTVHWRDSEDDSRSDMDAVLAALERLRSQSRAGLRRIPDPPARWTEVLAGDGLVGCGWCTPSWAEAYGSVLIMADELPDAADDALVHGDVRSDNLCIGPDDQVRFVDWSHAGSGNPFHDLVSLLPTLRLEGGPKPSQVLAEPTGLIVRQAGNSVARTFGDHSGPDWLRVVLRQLAAINLAWACEILDLALPDGESFPDQFDGTA